MGNSLKLASKSFWDACIILWGFPCGSDGKESACNAGDLDLIPESGRYSGGGHGNPLQYFCLENSMDRGAWWTISHRISLSWTRLKWLSLQACASFFEHFFASWYKILQVHIIQFSLGVCHLSEDNHEFLWEIVLGNQDQRVSCANCYAYCSSQASHKTVLGKIDR